MRYLFLLILLIPNYFLVGQNVISYGKKNDGNGNNAINGKCVELVDSLISFNLDSLVVGFNSDFSPNEPNSPVGENCSTQMIVNLYEDLESNRVLIASYIFDTENPQFITSTTISSITHYTYWYVINTDLIFYFNEDLCISGNSRSFVATIDIYDNGFIQPLSSYRNCYAFDSDIEDYNDNVFIEYFISDKCCKSNDKFNNVDNNSTSNISDIIPSDHINLLPLVVNGGNGLPIGVPSSIDISNINLIDQYGSKYQIKKEEDFINLGSLANGNYFLIWIENDKIVNYKFSINGF